MNLHNILINFTIFLKQLCFSRKADRLKERVINCEDLLNDNEAWLCQQQLQVMKIKVM